MNTLKLNCSAMLVLLTAVVAGTSLTRGQVVQQNAAGAQPAAAVRPSNSQSAERGVNGQAGPGARARHAGFNRLNLTDDQKTQAKAIFSQAHADIQALRDQARGQLRDLLTDEQKAKFDSRPHPLFGGRGPGSRGGRAMEKGVVPLGNTTEQTNQMQGPARLVQRLTAQLGLTTEQVSSISGILTDLHAAVQTRRQTARQQFQALLTPEQLAQINSKPGGFGGGWRHKGGPGGPGGADFLQKMSQKLGLTVDQQAQTQAIFSKTRTDVQTTRQQSREQIRALLTDDQKTRFDALPQGGPRGGMHRGGRWGAKAKANGAGNANAIAGPAGREARLLERLTNKLGLSADQQTGVKGILDASFASAKTAHDAARQQFRALLTPEQLQTLDQLKASHQRRR
jgi:Spy/CpxP family protein refolding chaperone